MKRARTAVACVAVVLMAACAGVVYEAAVRYDEGHWKPAAPGASTSGVRTISYEPTFVARFARRARWFGRAVALLLAIEIGLMMWLRVMTVIGTAILILALDLEERGAPDPQLRFTSAAYAAARGISQPGAYNARHAHARAVR